MTTKDHTRDIIENIQDHIFWMYRAHIKPWYVQIPQLDFRLKLLIQEIKKYASGVRF